MPVTITTLESGRRLKLAQSSSFTFTRQNGDLQRLGYKGVTPSTVLTDGFHFVPEGAGFIVDYVDLECSLISGWLVWRDQIGSVVCGYVDGMQPERLDSVRGLMRLPGEPKPGGEMPPKSQDGAKPLSQEAQAQVGVACPKCANGILVEKQGRFGTFVGCDGFPKCDFIWKKGHETEAKAKAEATTESRQQVQVQDDDTKALAELLGRIAGSKTQPIDADAVREIVRSEMANVKPGHVEYHVKVNEGEAKKLQARPHKMMAEVLRRAQMKNHRGMRVSQLLVGEAGTGKSTLCENVAEALGLTFVYVSCSGGMTESKLVGRLTPALQSGEEKYTPTPLVNAWEFGGVVLVDEIDASDPNVLLVLNGMMEAMHWTNPLGRTIERHADFILLAAANTHGQGADRKYVGRNQLDAAFLDRWLVATVDYDTDLEASLTTTSGLAAKWVVSREKIRSLGMRRTLSTRSLLRADMLVQQLGYSEKDAVIAATEGWTAEERTKVALA